jgi:uncharacterized protein YcfL
MKRWLFAVLVLLVLTGCKKAESQASTAARPASVICMYMHSKAFAVLDWKE